MAVLEHRLLECLVLNEAFLATERLGVRKLATVLKTKLNL
jgi:hypothetical protein